jgi:DNA-binding NtrC family response regulator
MINLTRSNEDPASSIGQIQLADKGTLLLIEVGEASLSVQRILLRLLQEGVVESSARGARRVDIRVIATSSSDLEKAVKEGSFREDLYYRLNVVNIHVPPLRQRTSDIPILVEYFLDKYYKRTGGTPVSIDEHAIAFLMNHNWPGNIQELENTIERAATLSGGLITPSDLALARKSQISLLDIAEQVREGKTLQDVLATVQRTMVAEALRLSKGDRSAAVRMLGISEDQLIEE